MGSTLVAFVGGTSGTWQVERFVAVKGPGLPPVASLRVVEGGAAAGSFTDATWVLRGAVSYERYVRQAEHDALARRRADLGRVEASHAALIPISKSPAWWSLSQDERRQIFEERSQHIATTLDYLPAIARRLHHGYDRGEPFDFLTWFEYAPSADGAFEHLVGLLRQTEEWTYVEREIDLRLTRARIDGASVPPSH